MFCCWWNVYLWTNLCNFVAIWHLFAQSLSIVLRCGGQLLNATCSFSSARCIRWPGLSWSEFLAVISSTACSWALICCTWLIRTPITVCSASYHSLLLEFDIPELRPQLFHWSLKYQGVEHPNLEGASCRHEFECGMTFPTLCLPPELWMGSRVQSTVAWLLSWVIFSSLYHCTGACGVVKAIFKHLCFSIGPLLLVLMIIIIIIKMQI